MRFLASASLHFHSLRYLRPVQVWGRLLFRLLKPSPDLRAPPPQRAVPSEWRHPAERRTSMIGPYSFRFLNEDGAVTVGSEWKVPGRSKLWQYNVHYFDDLNALRSSERVSWHQPLVDRWINDNGPGSGVGWEPYPTSLRIVNWIKWAWSGNALTAAAQASLAIQARWLVRRLETHLMGNHLFANAKALVFAGCFFEGPEASSWLKEGMNILVREIPEQILPDGGHFERSTMYHALALEDMLDLVNLATACPVPFASWAPQVSLWPEVVRRMGRWLSAMCHPDGEIAFFNDAAMGIAPTPSALAEYAERLGIKWELEHNDGVVWLEHSGYVRAQIHGAVLLIDVAPVGPDYLPAHAHADTLTFELSLYEQRVVVNSGTSCYGLGEQRELERATAAHNTVEVEGKNSSEVWGGFRVARRARPFGVVVREAEDTIRIEGAHDGYRRWSRPVIHRRSWELRAGMLQVVDRLEGRAGKAIARVHFHPDLRLEDENNGGVARWDHGIITWASECCESSIVASTWHPEFGVSVPASALALQLGGRGHGYGCRLVLNWGTNG